ncbi:tandem-95 repeat protein, partial [Ramlibacter sp.]|uniref:tandem-95 repeat protein n=1 Tax=Ramlibacter sp. TaxID=1917967 RepID=UPI0035AE8C07
MDPRVIGTVVLIEGTAIAKSADGRQRQLKLGDPVFEGEVVSTMEESRVELGSENGGRVVLRTKESVQLEAVLFDNALTAADIDTRGNLLSRVAEATDPATVDTEGISQEQEEDEERFGSTSLLDRIRVDDGNSFVRLPRIAEELPRPPFVTPSLGEVPVVQSPLGDPEQDTPVAGVEFEDTPGTSPLEGGPVPAPTPAPPAPPPPAPAPTPAPPAPPPPAPPPVEPPPPSPPPTPAPTPVPAPPPPPTPPADDPIPVTPPSNRVPPAQVIAEDDQLTLGGSRAIVVTDADSATITTTVTVTSGTLLAVTGGATIIGNGTSSVQISGSPAQVNQALDGLRFTPVADTPGSVTLTVTTTDGVFSAGDTVGITVTSVPDIVNDTATTAMNTAVTINVLGNDTFEGTPSVSAVNGTAITDGGAAVIVTNGSVQLVSGRLVFTPATGFVGTPSFNYTAISGGSTETATVNVTITAPPPPINAVPGAQTTAEDTPLAFTGAATISVSDANNDLQTVRLSVTNGNLNVSLVGGASISSGANNTSTLTLAGTQAQINSALATLRFSPTADYNGSALLTVVSTDGISNDTDTVAITVTPVADIVSDAITTPKNTAATANLLSGFGTTSGTADNFEGSPSISSITQGANGFVTVGAGGNITYTPNTGFVGSDSFTYVVTSPTGVTETATVNVTVSAVNEAPVNKVPASIVVDEDTLIAVSGVSVDDSNTDVVSATLQVTHGYLTVTSGGATVTGNGTAGVQVSGTQSQINAVLASINYRPHPDYNGSDSLTITTTDAATLSDTDTIPITVRPVVDIADDTQSTPQNTPVTIAVLGNDSFEATPTITQVAGTAITSGGAAVAVTNGSVQLVGSSLVFTPTAGFAGVVPAFTYTVSSGLVTETANVRITVTTPNSPVNTVPGAQSIPEDGTLAFTGGATVSVSDPDGNLTGVTLAVTNGTLDLTSSGLAVVTGVGTASVTITGTQADINATLTSLKYIPSPDFNGNDTLTVTSTDGTFSDLDTVAITVTPVVDITADTLTTTENTVVTANVLTGTGGATADNFEGSPNVTAVGTPTNGAVTFTAAGQVVYTPNASFNGTDRFTYTVTSPAGVTETATVTVNVGSVSDAPVNTVPVSQTTTEDTSIAFTGARQISVTDAENDVITARLSVSHGGVNVVLGGGATISAGANGSATLTLSGTQAQINAALATLTYNPTADFNGTDTLTIVSTDATALTDTDSVVITVTSVADTVVDAATTPLNTAVTVNVLSNDTFENAGRAITGVGASAVTDGGAAVAVANGTVRLTGGQLEFVPTTGFTGSTSFTYTVTSGGVTETETVNVTVSTAAPPNAPVNTVPGTQSTNEDTAFSFTGPTGISVADVDGNVSSATLTVTHGTLSVTAGGATVVGNNTGTVVVTGTQANINTALGTLQFRPTADYNDSGSSANAAVLTVVTSDGTFSDTDTVSIRIGAVPDIVADAATTPQDTAITINVLSNDTFEAAGVIINVGGSALTDGGAAVTVTDGTVRLSGGQLVYTPTTGFVGSTNFIYTVSSGGVTEAANVNVTVTNVNDPPVNTVPSARTVAEDGTLAFTGGATISVADADTNLSSATLTVTNGVLNASNAGGATVTNNGTATVTLTGSQAQINTA